MKRICFAGKFDLSGGGVELMDALHAGKRIAIFYRSERTRYEIKSEYWFAITRAMHLARERALTLEVFCYEPTCWPTWCAGWMR